MSSKEDFISQVCDALKKAVESASGVTLEGREREFRRVLVRRLFDETLGWEGHSKIGEIYDITCFDDENFPIIVIETKWGVEPTREIKEKLRKRIEELGSVRYGVFASERDFIVYEYTDHELKDITKINVAEAAGVARGEYGLSQVGERYILKLETLKRERIVWIEDPDYFEKTHKEISVAKREGVEVLTENLKDVIRDTTRVLMNFFDSYRKRKDHYSGSFLESTFKDWLRLSMKDEDFKKGKENERRKIVEVFCRETAYVLLGKILFTRICEDKGIIKLTISGKGLAESLRYYEKRRKNPYLLIFDESREEIGKYYTHLYELGYFDWWWISPEKIGVLGYEDKRIQDTLEEDLNDSIKKMFRRFNRFDFTQVDRDILGDVYQGYLPPNERKRLGEFYTPKEVIEYILDAVGYKPEKEIRGKKILDPACGSGSFLVEAMQRLIERYRRVGFNLKDPDDAKQVIDGSFSSIYGLDIHPFACFIAEMNLLFQLVDLYDVVRQKYKYYELSRLRIYRTDSLVPSSEVIIELIEFMDNSRRKTLIEETKGANKIKDMRFNFVVGNPPYVRIERIPEERREFFKKHYRSALERFDLYMLFIEKGITWLKDKGTFGFITSNKYIRTDTGRGLRDFIVENCAINQLLDFGGTGVFAEVTVDPSIIILRKDGIERKEHLLKFVIVKKPVEDLLKHIEKYISLDEYFDEHVSIFQVKQLTLEEGVVWRFISEKGVQIFDYIKKKADFELKEVTEANRLGIVTGANPVFIVNQETIENYHLEKELIKPLTRGKQIRRWKIFWDGSFIIYPYKRDGDKLTLVDIIKYPNTKKYLEKHLERLKSRYCTKKLGKPWYELHDPVAQNVFDTPKIMTPDMSPYNNFALDEEGKFHYMDTSFSIVPKETIDIKYLLGLLNSNVIEFYFKQISQPIGPGAYRYKTTYTEKLPIKLPKTSEERNIAEQIIQGVDQILRLNRQLKSIEERIKQFPNSYFNDGWSFDKLMNVVKAQNLSKPSYTVSERLLKTHYLKDLERKEIFRISLAPNEYIDFSSEEAASYVFEVLKTLNRITRRELLELKIPAQEHLKILMYQYRKDKEQIVKNEEAIKELEKQINDLVYKLYDIAYKERRIIEECLAKF